MDRIELPDQLNTFLFMGCWNKEGCQTDSAQSKVAARIREEPADSPLFLGGDNVYPDKDPITKKKTYSAERLAQGIRCLIRDVERPLFAAIGNHNLPLLPTELESPWILPAPSYRVRFSNGVSVLVLDSNPWDMGDEEEGRHVLEALAIELADLRSRREPYYCIMHHPLISYKKSGTQILPQHAAVLDQFIQYPPLLLLVADTHNYQKGIIHWKGGRILQVVSGTGGADLDPINFRGPVKGFDGSYELLEDKVAYGYQRITGTEAKFVLVQTGGYRRSRNRTYRRR